MRKSERLDQILIRLGYVTTAQVEEAVARQASAGGRIGTNLVELGALTEEQLFDGLVEQFRVPTITVDDRTVDRLLLGRMPLSALEGGLIVPVSWNEALGVLSLAVANPSDEELIEEVRAAFGARKVRVSLAPESVLASLVERLLQAGEGPPGAGSVDEGVRLVALPELFEPPDEPVVGGSQEEGEEEVHRRRIVMVSAGAARRNFLPAVFSAESCELIVARTVEEARDAMEGADGVLISFEMASTWATWLETGQIADPPREVTHFTSVSAALLDNPAPYVSMVASTRACAQAIAEYRAAVAASPPPYTMMVREADTVAEALGLGRLATDGLAVGLHLLVPAERGTSIDPFLDFAGSIELAHRMRFPWPIESVLSQCLSLYLGRVEPNASTPHDQVMLAAQVLALVWFRHNLLELGPTASEDPMVETRARIRELIGRFATLEVVEAYLQVIEHGDELELGSRRVLLVGGDRLGRLLGPALRRTGVELASAESALAARSAAGETVPDAIVVDRASFGEETEAACTELRAHVGTLMFVLVDDANPGMVLNLLDAGVDDVFTPPHDYELMSARILRAVRARVSLTDSAEIRQGQFAATFDTFPFLDLAQMLANGLRSARVEFRRGDGEEAELYFAKGRPIRALCGSLSGPAAVYRIISWESEGEFRVTDVSEFPDPNIDESMESLLMEGVRLLDESRA